MLFATYPPPSAPKKSNPWLIVLGVCGGGCVLVVVACVVFGLFVGKSMGGLFGGAQKMIPFVANIQNHKYAIAETMVAPSAQANLNAAKLQAIEEKIEAKLGPPVSTPPRMLGSSSDTSAGTNPTMENIKASYRLSLKYQKGAAVATVSIKMKDGIYDLKIDPATAGDSGN